MVNSVIVRLNGRIQGKRKRSRECLLMQTNIRLRISHENKTQDGNNKNTIRNLENAKITEMITNIYLYSNTSPISTLTCNPVWDIL